MQAIAARHYPLIQGCILVVLLFYMLINLAVDVLYFYIDPRVHYDKAVFANGFFGAFA